MEFKENNSEEKKNRQTNEIQRVKLMLSDKTNKEETYIRNLKTMTKA